MPKCPIMPEFSWYTGPLLTSAGILDVTLKFKKKLRKLPFNARHQICFVQSNIPTNVSILLYSTATATSQLNLTACVPGALLKP